VITGGARYAVGRRLGAGSMGVVYEAHDLERGVKVAVKTLRRLDAAALRRFKDEFRSLADVTHPNLAALYELVAEGDQWFLAMELVDGRRFLDWVRGGDVQPEDAHAATLTPITPATPHPTLPPPGGGEYATMPPLETGEQFERLRAGLAQLAEGVAALHAAGKLHRDIKPSNVLVDRQGRVVLLDFGLVIGLGDREGAVVGTPAYMAPEQAAGGRVVPASDWYSVGVMLYEALTGQLPFSGSHVQMIVAKQEQEAPRPSSLVPAVPPDLDELCAGLLRRDPTARARLEGAASPPPGGGRAGRGAAEVAVLRNAQRSNSALLIRGPLGAGKSELVQQFLSELRATDALVLAGRCHRHESVPFKAVDAVVDELSRHLEQLPAAERVALMPDDGGALVRLFPVLGDIGELAAGSQADDVPPRELQRRGFAALRDLLGSLSARRPVVLAIDDLHWGDADSAPLLRDLARAPDAPPVCLIGTALAGRDDSPVIAALLDAAAGPSRAVALLDLAPPSAEEARRIDDSIRARIDRLPPPARMLLELIAIAERPLAAPIALAAAAAAPPALTALRAANLIRAVPGRAPDAVDVDHERVGELALECLAAAARADRHRALAAALAQAGDADPEELAVHLAAAGDRAAAADQAERAAGEARATFAVDRAARMLAFSLELAPDQPRAPELRRRLAGALADAGRPLAAAETYLAIADNATPAEAVSLRRAAAEQLLLGGHLDQGLELVRDAVRDLGMSMPESRWRLYASLATRRARLRLRGLSWRERTEPLPARVRDQLELGWRACLGILLGDHVLAFHFHTEHLTRALAAGDPLHVALGTVFESGLQASLGNRERGEALWADAAAIAARIDEPSVDGHLALAQTVPALYTGRWADCVDACERADARFRSLPGCAYELTNSGLARSLALYYLGRIDALTAHVHARIASATERGDLLGAMGMRTGAGNFAWLASGDPDGARDAADTAIASWPPRGGHIVHYDLFAQCHIDLYRGDGAGAARRFEARLPAVQRTRILRLVRPRIESLDLRGRCALGAAAAGTDRSRNLRLAMDCAERLDREQATWSTAMAALLRAGVEHQRGQEVAARADLAVAERHFTAGGMVMHAAVAGRRHEELRAAGIADPDAVAACLAPGFPAMLQR
jgi:hypothetical protein